MRGFLVLLVFSAVGLAGVLAWRKSLQAPPAPVVAAAGAPAKAQRHHRRRGARRMARNEIPNDLRNEVRNDVVVATAPADEAPARDTPTGDGTSRVFAPSSEERAPLAPGGASVTEMPPSPGILDEPAAAPIAASAPSGARRQPVYEPEPVKLSAADLKIVWQGPDLSRAETVRLDFSNEGGHELSQDEIDVRFHTKEDAVLACIARARPDQDTYVPGRVTVRFRVERSGIVKNVQVEAPVILHKGGLTSCLKGVVTGLRFPASGMSQVVTYPFSLI
jgi:hypothetical protein